jgi:hypothetical protein
MMKAYLPLLALLASLAFLSAASVRPLQREEDVAVPLHYSDQALVIVTDAGVAAVQFQEPIEKGMTFRFRIRPADGGEEKTGDGKVFEKYERIPATNPGDTTRVVDRAGQLNIVVGDISLRWSFGSRDFGWVYFSPETEHVFVISRDSVAELDLARFRR